MIDRELYRSIPIRSARLTLCGSTRFRDAFDFWNTHLTLAGNLPDLINKTVQQKVKFLGTASFERHTISLIGLCLILI